MNIGNFVFLLILTGIVIYLLIRLAIWIIKTAIKEALREYDQEKRTNGS